MAKYCIVKDEGTHTPFTTMHVRKAKGALINTTVGATGQTSMRLHNLL